MTAAPGAVAISVQLPRRRRRLGLALVAVGVLVLAAQSWFEWLLPYDLAALEVMRKVFRAQTLSPTELVWWWALVCGVLLLLLERSRAASRLETLGSAVLCGLALGSAQVAAGGPAAASALLLLVAVASLGWHARSVGGLAWLLATAASMAAWDAVMSKYPSLWLPAAALCLTFVWIDHMHIRANDKRLFGALAERESLIHSLDQRTAQLTALQGARTRLLASISHDLRQPLQAVRLFAEALQAPDEPGTATAANAARKTELLRQQMRAADDAVAMLDQFSEFSAIEQGALQSHPTLVDVRDVLDGVAASLQATHPRERLAITVHGRPQWLYTDRTQLARLVQNLAGNAVRYSLGVRPGEPARVVLAVREHRFVLAADADADAGNAVAGSAAGAGARAGAEGGDRAPVQSGLAIDVFDNGRGIPPDQLEAVFEPYVQLTDASSGASRGGRGLGLAIVRGLVAQLGLQLAPLRSTLGRGTRFRVCVPAALRCSPEHVAHAAEPGKAASKPEDSTRLDGWLLALLDDEPAARAALRAALEGAGATLVDAPSLELLKTRLDAEPRFPDALVFDLDLGAGQPDGLAAVEELRAEWELPVPAVIVTGRVAVMGTVPMPKRSAVLGKPVPLALLVATLRQLAQRAPEPSTAGAGAAPAAAD